MSRTGKEESDNKCWPVLLRKCGEVALRREKIHAGGKTGHSGRRFVIVGYERWQHGTYHGAMVGREVRIYVLYCVQKIAMRCEGILRFQQFARSFSRLPAPLIRRPAWTWALSCAFLYELSPFRHSPYVLIFQTQTNPKIPEQDLGHNWRKGAVRAMETQFAFRVCRRHGMVHSKQCVVYCGLYMLVRHKP